ncbi:MAG: glycogen debranching protein GlgX [Mycobacteriales bacterium]
MTQVWPGHRFPLGASWDGEGVNVSLFAEAAAEVNVCLFDEAGREERVPLEEQTFHVWHGYLPQVGPGQQYGLRVEGPSDPGRGARYDAAKLLADPYARAFAGGFTPHDDVFAPGRDSAPWVPRCVVVHDAFPWGEDTRPAHPWSDTVIYELHVKGFTARHPDIPERLRGTFAGLAHPAAVAHLQRLGVTAVELMPVHQFVTEPEVARRGRTNYWGYNTLGYFAPHGAYAAGGDRGAQVLEFKAMVRALHRAGIEVLLDVVYNHTAEGNETGPTLFLRGIDNAAYYRLRDDDLSRYIDYTGCGNTLDARQPHVLGLIMDSLRYWVSEMHVDGFRFDLAAALARSFHDVDKLSGFFDVIAQDPVISQVKLIAEPWDVGAGGYQVGEFPPLWTEWNGKFRDAVRDFWRGADTGVAELGYRLTGSSDLYQDDGRRPFASINFVTAHDGFTLADLVSYDTKHNEANGEDNEDGTDDNRSWNGGAEGPTTDPAVVLNRRRRRRALLATLLLASGVPMLEAGDELGRTQLGNNNGYCHDDDLTWLDWSAEGELADPAGPDPCLLRLVEGLVALRRRHPVLRRRSFFQGRPTEAGGLKDVAWFTAAGSEMVDADWFQPSAETLGMYLSGDGIRTRGARGERVTDASFLLWLHAGAEDTTVTLPGSPWSEGYALLLDTAAENLAGFPDRPGGRLAPGQALAVASRSVVLLQARPNPAA